MEVGRRSYTPGTPSFWVFYIVWKFRVATPNTLAWAHRLIPIFGKRKNVKFRASRCGVVARYAPPSKIGVGRVKSDKSMTIAFERFFLEKSLAQKEAEIWLSVAYQ